MNSGCGILRAQCLQLHKCTLSKTLSLKMGNREGADTAPTPKLSHSSPAILHLPPKPAPPRVSPFQLVAALAFWMLKPKVVETSLTPLFLSHPHPVPQ